MHAPVLSDQVFYGYIFYVILTAFIFKPVRYISLNIKCLKRITKIFPSAYKVQCPFFKG